MIRFVLMTFGLNEIFSPQAAAIIGPILYAAITVSLNLTAISGDFCGRQPGPLRVDSTKSVSQAVL